QILIEIGEVVFGIDQHAGVVGVAEAPAVAVELEVMAWHVGAFPSAGGSHAWGRLAMGFASARSAAAIDWRQFCVRRPAGASRSAPATPPRAAAVQDNKWRETPLAFRAPKHA